MAAALSPDGRTLMIDLQGSLWTLPASGGPAKRVTDEYLDARQPAWAPDNRASRSRDTPTASGTST